VKSGVTHGNGFDMKTGNAASPLPYIQTSFNKFFIRNNFIISIHIIYVNKFCMFVTAVY
jgi:hypothetical protein